MTNSVHPVYAAVYVQFMHAATCNDMQQSAHIIQCCSPGKCRWPTTFQYDIFNLNSGAGNKLLTNELQCLKFFSCKS